jgi:hypothetical protein
MTFRQHASELLNNYALMPNEIEGILSRIESRAESGNMESRLNDAVGDYIPGVVTAFTFMLKTDAVKYLEETKPLHFMLPALRGDL